MSVTEQQRLHLFKTLEQRLGDEDAATMMAMLPPASSHGVATKEDLAALRQDLALHLERRLSETSNKVVGWMVGSMAVQTAVIGLLLAITH